VIAAEVAKAGYLTTPKSRGQSAPRVLSRPDGFGQSSRVRRPRAHMAWGVQWRLPLR